MSPTLHVSYASGRVFGSAGRVLGLWAGRSCPADAASFGCSALSGAGTPELALRFAEPGLLGEGVGRGRSCGAGIFAGSWEGWVGTATGFAGLVWEGPLAGWLLSCAPFCVRRSSDGDAMGPDIGRPGFAVCATAADCDASEFFLLRDRGRPCEPWSGDLEANWKAWGDAFLASLVRTGDVVNMVVRGHGQARGWWVEGEEVYPSKRGQAGHIRQEREDDRASLRMSVRPVAAKGATSGRLKAVWGFGGPRGEGQRPAWLFGRVRPRV